MLEMAATMDRLEPDRPRLSRYEMRPVITAQEAAMTNPLFAGPDHGEPITMADVVYAVAAGHDRAYDQDKSRIETAMAVTARPYLETFRGFRVLDESKLEVYVDFWHFDDNHIASYASPTGLSMPWEILFAMDQLVFEERRAAYSDTAAARFNVPWLSLVMERDARLVERTLETLQAGAVVPAALLDTGTGTLVDDATAGARYDAALAWMEEHGHLVVSNGPYQLAAYDPPAQFAELRAYRDDTYPFRPGDWHLGAPPALRIDAVDVPAVTAGQEAQVTVTVEGPGTVGVRYLLLDPATGELLADGDAVPRDDRRFDVGLDAALTGELGAGLHRLFLAAHSDEVAVVAERAVDLEVVP
jgi:peptide/nickel transport system substrate-binding protein